MKPNIDPVYLASQGLSPTFPERFMSKNVSDRTILRILNNQSWKEEFHP
jgi:hypothetical protein